MSAQFSRYLFIGDNPTGIIEVTFVTHDQENAFSKWQNSTMLMIIKARDGRRLWTGEYTYKGGMELSGFAVNSQAEGAKLVASRMADKFRLDYRLK